MNTIIHQELRDSIDETIREQEEYFRMVEIWREHKVYLFGFPRKEQPAWQSGGNLLRCDRIFIWYQDKGRDGQSIWHWGEHDKLPEWAEDLPELQPPHVSLFEEDFSDEEIEKVQALIEAI